MYDVIVVGARCAGASVALRFAQSGYSVLALDKSRLGSDTLSTHVLVPGAVRQLAALGLLEELLATGAPPIRTMLVEFDGESHPQPIDEPPGFLLSIRRTTLDPIIVKAAAKSGVKFDYGVRVEELIWQDDRVVGIRGLKDGQTYEAFARLVIGADGRHSIVARRVDSTQYNIVHSLGSAIYAYFSQVGPTDAGADVLQFASGPGCDSLCCPCDGGLHVVLLIITNEEFGQIKSSPEYEARLRSVPTLAVRLVDAQCVSRLFRASAQEVKGYFRKPYGPGWALVGDAGYYAHPAAANGINDALRSSALLHEDVSNAWRSGQAAETYLDHFHSVRDAENMEPYYNSYQQGSVNPFRDPVLAANVRDG